MGSSGILKITRVSQNISKNLQNRKYEFIPDDLVYLKFLVRWTDPSFPSP